MAGLQVPTNTTHPGELLHCGITGRDPLAIREDRHIMRDHQTDRNGAKITDESHSHYRMNQHPALPEPSVPVKHHINRETEPKGAGLYLDPNH